MAPGTRRKFFAQMFEPVVSRSKCTVVLVTMLGIFGARGTVTNLPHPPLRPWLQKIRIPTRRKYLYSVHCLCCTDAQTRHHCRYVFCLHQLLRGQPFDRRDKVFHKCGLGKIAWFCQACDMEMKSCMTLR